MDFWYLRISRRATVPGRKRWGFLTPPVAAWEMEQTRHNSKAERPRRKRKGWMPTTHIS